MPTSPKTTHIQSAEDHQRAVEEVQRLEKAGHDRHSEKRRAALAGRVQYIESTAEFRIGDIDFEPFSVPHDAVDNFGFIARRDGVKVATVDLRATSAFRRIVFRRNLSGGTHTIQIRPLGGGRVDVDAFVVLR